jgi:hypothetical protein
MTLVELVVTLSILVALASVAIVSLDGLNDDSRYSETRRRGAMVLEVVNGDAPGDPGAFPADMGRLPAVASAVRGAELAELFYSSDAFSALDPSELYGERVYSNPATDWAGGASGATFNFSSATKNVRLQCGWRGPYLALTVSKFRDGWGNDWWFETTDDDTWTGTPSWSETPLVGKTVFGLMSTGKNGQVDSSTADWENADARFSFERSLTTSDLTVSIMRIDSSVSPSVPVPVDSSFMDYVRVAVFAPYVTPDGVDADNVKRVLAYNDNGSAGLSVSPAADAGFPHYELSAGASWSGFHSVTLRGLSPGRRKLYVYGFKGASASSNKFGSRLLDIELKPGGNAVTVYLVEAL